MHAPVTAADVDASGKLSCGAFFAACVPPLAKRAAGSDAVTLVPAGGRFIARSTSNAAGAADDRWRSTAAGGAGGRPAAAGHVSVVGRADSRWSAATHRIASSRSPASLLPAARKMNVRSPRVPPPATCTSKAEFLCANSSRRARGGSGDVFASSTSIRATSLRLPLWPLLATPLAVPSLLLLSTPPPPPLLLLPPSNSVTRLSACNGNEARARLISVSASLKG